MSQTRKFKHLLLAFLYISSPAVTKAMDYSLQQQAARAYIACHSPGQINEHIQSHKLSQVIQKLLKPLVIQKHSSYLDSCYSKNIKLNYGITQIAFLTNNVLVALSSRSACAYIIDSTTGKITYTLKGHTDEITSVAVSADGRYALTGSGDGTARLWDASTGQLVRIFYNFVNAAITVVALNFDGRYALTGSRNSTVRLWDCATGTCMKTLVGHTQRITAVQFSSDTTQALTASRDGTVCLWNILTDEPICIAVLSHDIDNQLIPIKATILSSDGCFVLAGAADGNAYLWDTRTSQVIRILRGHLKSVTSVALSPCGRYALTGSKDRRAHVWDLSTGKLLKSIDHFRSWQWDSIDHTVQAVAFSPDGKQLVTILFNGNAFIGDVDYCTHKISLSDLLEKLIMRRWCTVV